MFRVLVCVLVSGLGLFGSVHAHAQAVTVQVQPAQPGTGQEVTLVLDIDTPDCLLFAHSPVVRVGQEVRVDYTIDPGNGTCGVPPPTTRRGIALGSFAAGSYTAIASGTNLTSSLPLAPASRGFVVVDSAQNIPSNTIWTLLLLAGITLAFAWGSLLRR